MVHQQLFRNWTKNLDVYSPRSEDADKLTIEEGLNNDLKDRKSRGKEAAEMKENSIEQ